MFSDKKMEKELVNINIDEEKSRVILV